MTTPTSPASLGLCLQKKNKKEQELVIKVVKKEEPCVLMLGMKTGAAIMENNVGVPQKFKNTTVICSSNSITGYLLKQNENI